MVLNLAVHFIHSALLLGILTDRSDEAVFEIRFNLKCRLISRKLSM